MPFLYFDVLDTSRFVFCTLLTEQRHLWAISSQRSRLSLQCHPRLTWFSIMFGNITCQKSPPPGIEGGASVSFLYSLWWLLSLLPHLSLQHNNLSNNMRWDSGRGTQRRSLIEDILYTSFMEHGELSDFLNFLWICVCVFVEVGWVVDFMMGV